MALDWLTGSSPEVTYGQSPEQEKMWNTMFPVFKNFMQGNFPEMYDVPSPVGPTTDWYNNISPAVRESLWEPAREGGNQLMETLGAKGMMGGASTPASGSGATAMGKLFADYSQGIGGQAWNMMQPGLMADYSAQLGRNITGYNTSLMPFQTAAGMLPGTYSTPFVDPGSPGAFQSLLPMGAAFGMSHMPWGNFGGMFGGGGGTGGPSIPSFPGTYMGPPQTYNKTYQPRP